MGIKTFACPNCGCVMQLPQYDGEDTVLPCIACRVPIVLKTSAKGATVAEVA